MAETPARIGNYEVARRLGGGGMGTVYLGRDPELGRAVAIKVLKDELHDQELLDRFFREARASAALRHPNIITIYASGQYDFKPYIAMEFVDGESLADVIRHRRQLTLGDKLSYIEQLCAGLHFAHRQGIVHRDIKPANLMIDREGVVRILDFGIAHVEGSGMTRDGQMIGTLNYMSPEQMLGRPVDHRSDIFAVGAVAYEVLAYQQAFKGGLTDGLLHRLPHEPPAPLNMHCPGISRDLEQAIMRALEKQPERRFPDLAAMRAAILAVRQQIDADAMLETILVSPDAQRRASSRGSHSVGTPSAGSERDALGLLNQPRETREISVRQRITDAGVRLERGDTVGAARLLREAMALDPANATASEMLARVQQQTPRTAPSDPTIRTSTPFGTTPATPDGPVALARGSKTRAWVIAAVILLAAGAGIPYYMLKDRPGEVATLDAQPTPDPVTVPAPPPEPVVQPQAAPPPGPVSTPSPAAQPQVQPQPSAPARSAGGAPSAAGAATTAPPPVVTPPPPASAPPKVDTTARDALVDDVVSRFNALYRDGQYAGALNVLQKSPDLWSESRVQSLPGRVYGAVSDLLSSSASDAKTANAGTLAATTLRLATDAQSLSEQFRQKGDFINASAQALIARDYFDQAVREARARKPAPPPTEEKPQVTSAPPPSTPARPSFAQEEPLIVGALGRLAAAYGAMDVGMLKKAFPSVGRETEQAFNNQRGACRKGTELRFGKMEFAFSADGRRVNVEVPSTYTCRPGTGQTLPPVSQRDLFILTKQGSDWYITSTSRID